MKNLKIYKTVITVEILSGEPINNIESMNLADIGYEIDQGMWSGTVTANTHNQELTGEAAEDAIHNQGTDLDFFLIGEEEEGD